MNEAEGDVEEFEDEEETEEEEEEESENKQERQDIRGEGERKTGTETGTIIRRTEDETGEDTDADTNADAGPRLISFYPDFGQKLNGWYAVGWYSSSMPWFLPLFLAPIQPANPHFPIQKVFLEREGRVTSGMGRMNLSRLRHRTKS
jgi:hypothetical protein